MEELAQLLQDSGGAYDQDEIGTVEPMSMQPGLAVEGSQKVLRPSRCGAELQH